MVSCSLQQPLRIYCTLNSHAECLHGCHNTVCFQPISTRDQGSLPSAPGNMDLQRASKRSEQEGLGQEPLQGTVNSHPDENRGSRCALTVEGWQFLVLRKSLPCSGDDNNKIDPFWCQSQQPLEGPRNLRV